MPRKRKLVTQSPLFTTLLIPCDVCSSVHGTSGQEYLSVLPFPPPCIFLDPKIEPITPHCMWISTSWAIKKTWFFVDCLGHFMHVSAQLCPTLLSLWECSLPLLCPDSLSKQYLEWAASGSPPGGSSSIQGSRQLKSPASSVLQADFYHWVMGRSPDWLW